MGLADREWKRRKYRQEQLRLKRQSEQPRRDLILKWYKLLEPFDRLYPNERDKLLGALADALSRHAIRSVVSTVILYGGALTVICTLPFLFGHVGPWRMATMFAFGIVGIVIFAFKSMRDDMRHRLEEYATGWWVANDPFTGNEVYKVMQCPKCYSGHNVNAYLRYLEPCKYCGHNIDWEAAKLS
jgi:hypothetical protein